MAIKCNFRKMNDNDSLKMIAELIYFTDVYIYPACFDTLEIAQEIIPELIKSGTNIFSKENIYLLEENDHIIGLCVLLCELKKWNTFEILSIFEKKNIKIPENFHYASKEYFTDVADNFKFDQLYIMNVCIHRTKRELGYGNILMQSLFNHFNHKTFMLHVLKDNLSAINLYRKTGFHVIREEKGFSISPDSRPQCYCMVNSRS